MTISYSEARFNQFAQSATTVTSVKQYRSLKAPISPSTDMLLWPICDLIRPRDSEELGPSRGDREATTITLMRPS